MKIAPLEVLQTAGPPPWVVTLSAITALFLTLASPPIAGGQGRVQFLNNVPFPITDPTGGGHLVYDVGSALDRITGVRLTGTNYVAQLYFGANADSLQPLPEAIAHFRPPTTLQPGTWNYPLQFVTMPGVPYSSYVTLQVRVWDIAQFSSYEEAFGKGLTGESTPFMYLTPPEVCQPPACYFMEGLQAFALVPEPPIISSFILGTACLLLLRVTTRKGRICKRAGHGDQFGSETIPRKRK